MKINGVEKPIHQKPVHNKNWFDSSCQFFVFPSSKPYRFSINNNHTDCWCHIRYFRQNHDCTIHSHVLLNLGRKPDEEQSVSRYIHDVWCMLLPVLLHCLRCFHFFVREPRSIHHKRKKSIIHTVIYRCYTRFPNKTKA